MSSEMTATIILSPTEAVKAVAHDEQLRIWAHDDMIGALALGGWLRDDLTYDDMIDLEGAVKRELLSILECAFDHPEAKTIKSRR